MRSLITLQDEIAFKIMKILQVNLQPAQSGSDVGRGPTNLEALLQRALGLNASVAQSFVMSSMACLTVGRYDEAQEEAKKAVDLDPGSLLAQVALAATSILTGQEEDTRAAAEEVLKINPAFSVEQYRSALLFKDTRQVDLVVDALCKAGLK